MEIQDQSAKREEKDPDSKGRKNKSKNKHKKKTLQYKNILSLTRSFQIDRLFCFNEPKLKDFLIKHDLPLTFNNLRILKEHASASVDEKVDMVPALYMISQQYPKVNLNTDCDLTTVLLPNQHLC